MRENERMDVGDMKQPSYLDYIQLWLHIMDPSKLKVSPVHVYMTVCVSNEHNITSYSREFN